MNNLIQKETKATPKTKQKGRPKKTKPTEPLAVKAEVLDSSDHLTQLEKPKNGWGGARLGAGRKKKTIEEQATMYLEENIIKVYGSVDRFYEHIVRESMSSTAYMTFVLQYLVGKPKERADVNLNVPQITINNDWK